MFRGREMSHPEVGHDVLQRALAKLQDSAGVERPPGMEGRFLSVILTPAKKPVVKAADEESPAEDAENAPAAAVEGAPANNDT
jgi:translation initiation factor IF-3